MTLRRTVGGEGPTAREALEGLAFGLDDEQIEGVLMIRVKRDRIKEFGNQPAYDGFIAEVVR